MMNSRPCFGKKPGRMVKHVLMVGILLGPYLTTPLPGQPVEYPYQDDFEHLPFKDNPAIQYIRPDIPNFEIPAYRGQRYTEQVPDTLDLAEMARLAINCLTESTNPDWDYDIYFWAQFFTNPSHDAPFRNPPVLRADCSSWCHMKFAEALPLMRIMCGDDHNSQVDTAWMSMILKSIGPDGLFYWPLVGRPYFRNGYAWMDTGVWDETGKSRSMRDETVTQFTHPVSGRYMGVMLLYYLREENPVFKNGVWRKTIEDMIDRWAEIPIYKGDYCYFPAAGYLPNARIPQDLPMPVNITGEECNNRLIQGLAQYYRINPYEPAKVLGQKLINYMRHQIKWFDSEARFIDGPADKFEVDFFHAYTIALLSMLEFALAVNDQELMQFVDKGFHYGIEQKVCPSVTEVGWFPENLRPNYPSCELCGTADMIALALKLTEAGTGDYWDEVDRWVRNQFAEGQLTKSEWVYENARKEPPTPVGQYETAEKAVERNLGGFAGWATANDWTVRNGIMHCCTGNATRAIYYVWERMIEKKDNRLMLHFLANRASRWADVYSHIPYQGQVDVKMKQAFEEVVIRAPQWIASGSQQVTCLVNDQLRTVSWEGRYLHIGSVAQGDRISLKFPISTRQFTAKVGDAQYTYDIKGTTVVAVSPQGKYCPLYQREQYRANQTRWINRERFVSSEQIRW